MSRQETQSAPETEVRPAIEAVVEQIAADSRREPQQYLDDTVVPNGGE